MFAASSVCRHPARQLVQVMVLLLMQAQVGQIRLLPKMNQSTATPL